MIIQPNAWSCLPCAFGNAIDCNVLARLGHDGSEIIWPDLEEPYCRRAFHIQECITALWDMGWAVTGFEVTTEAAPPVRGTEVYRTDCTEDVQQIMSSSRGVAVGLLQDGRRHALAWNGEWIDSGNVDIVGFDIECFYAITQRIVRNENRSCDGLC